MRLAGCLPESMWLMGGAMTQLARPDLVYRRSGLDHLGPGLAGGPEISPAARPGSVRAGRPVPGWAVVTASLVPVLLVAGWLIAGALQPASYSPMRQTISVLAGRSGTDRWVMTAALLLVGGCQIATGAGLTGVRPPARILLTLAGLSTVGVAANPEPATGPTPRHLAFAVSGVVMTAVWPVFVGTRAPVRSWILSMYTCATVTAVFVGLSGWLLIEAWDGGGNLGLAERLTSGALGLFPLFVALALHQSAQHADNPGQRSQDVSGTARQSPAPKTRLLSGARTVDLLLTRRSPPGSLPAKHTPKDSSSVCLTFVPFA